MEVISFHIEHSDEDGDEMKTFTFYSVETHCTPLSACYPGGRQTIKEIYQDLFLFGKQRIILW